MNDLDFVDFVSSQKFIDIHQDTGTSEELYFPLADRNMKKLVLSDIFMKIFSKVITFLK